MYSLFNHVWIFQKTLKYVVKVKNLYEVHYCNIYVGRNLMRNNSGLHALAHTKMMVVNFGDDNFKKWPVINVFVYNYQLVPTHIYVVGVVFIAITIHYTSHFHDNFRRWLTRGVSDESGHCELWTERLQKKKNRCWIWNLVCTYLIIIIS